MKSEILDGKAVAKAVENNVRNRVYDFEEANYVKVTLATIIVGSNPASKTYV